MSWSNFNLRAPDPFLAPSYLLATVIGRIQMHFTLWVLQVPKCTCHISTKIYSVYAISYHSPISQTFFRVSEIFVDLYQNSLLLGFKMCENRFSFGHNVSYNKRMLLLICFRAPSVHCYNLCCPLLCWKCYFGLSIVDQGC